MIHLTPNYNISIIVGVELNKKAKMIFLTKLLGCRGNNTTITQRPIDLEDMRVSFKDYLQRLKKYTEKCRSNTNMINIDTRMLHVPETEYVAKDDNGLVFIPEHILYRDDGAYDESHRLEFKMRQKSQKNVNSDGVNAP